MEIGQKFDYRPDLNRYLAKYSLRGSLIPENPQPDLGIVVVIPCHNEPHVEHALASLNSCTRPECSVEVIVVVNASEKAGKEIIERNRDSIQTIAKWSQQNEPKFKLYGLAENELPKKHAGVGLARKIGMDEAVSRLERAGNDDGVIACFDADSQCSPNYLVELENHFKHHPKTPGCSIRFAHPLFGTQFEPHTYLGIAYYELHLRYYNQALRATGYPNAFHTVGSSMAVRSKAYQKQGGMNRRQAGEDFYFLHKIISLGGFTELQTTCVFPSPRPSDRVPFGTGKAVGDYLKDTQKGMYTYHISAFRYLHQFFQNIPEYYLKPAELVKQGGQIPYVLIDFLSAYFFDERIEEIKRNSSNINSFTKRFYNWFNAFMILKFVHFVRDNAHPNLRVERAAMDLLRACDYPDTEKINSLNSLLEAYREIERKGIWLRFKK